MIHAELVPTFALSSPSVRITLSSIFSWLTPYNSGLHSGATSSGKPSIITLVSHSSYQRPCFISFMRYHHPKLFAHCLSLPPLPPGKLHKDGIFILCHCPQPLEIPATG